MKKLIRLKSALERLQTQLKVGNKPAKFDGKTHPTLKEPLTDSDISRINREIISLNEHIKKLS